MSAPRLYAGRALSGSVSHAVAIVAGGLALAALVYLTLWAVALGLPAGGFWG